MWQPLNYLFQNTLAPGTATGMTIGLQIAQPYPAAIATVRIGIEMARGVDMVPTSTG